MGAACTESDADESGAADASGHTVTAAAPTPKKTASAPTRPITREAFTASKVAGQRLVRAVSGTLFRHRKVVGGRM